MGQRRAGFETMIIVTFLMSFVTTAFTIVGSLNFSDIIPIDLLGAHYAYPIDIDIAWWFHLLWIPTALWQFIWLIYGLSTLCRKDLGTGAYLYYSPPFMPITMYAMYLVGGLCTIGWIFTTTYGFLGFALGFSAIIYITLFISLIFSAQGLHRHIGDLASSGQTREIKLVIGLVQNGIGMYDEFFGIMMYMCLGKVLVYIGGLSQEIAAIVVLSIFMVITIVFVLAEMTVWEIHTRYIITPYIVTTVAIISMVINNVDFVTWDTTSYMLVGALVLVCLALLIKVINACVHSRVDQRKKVPSTSVMVKY